MEVLSLGHSREGLELPLISACPPARPSHPDAPWTPLLASIEPEASSVRVSALIPAPLLPVPPLCRQRRGERAVQQGDQPVRPQLWLQPCLTVRPVNYTAVRTHLGSGMIWIWNKIEGVHIHFRSSVKELHPFLFRTPPILGEQK